MADAQESRASAKEAMMARFAKGRGKKKRAKGRGKGRKGRAATDRY